MASTTVTRAASLPLTSISGVEVVKDFGYFIDTHRDLPHIGFFDEDLHRGMCKPTKVHYDPNVGRLWSADMKRSIMVHEKHQFVTEEWFAQFIVRQMMTTGKSPLDGDGRMPTSLLRDPRKKIYELKSLRQMIVYHQKRLGIYKPV